MVSQPALRREVNQEKETGRDAYEILRSCSLYILTGGDCSLPICQVAYSLSRPECLRQFRGPESPSYKAHMTRAVLEGVSYGLNDSLELMRSMGISPENIVLSGGGAKSPYGGKCWPTF